MPEFDGLTAGDGLMAELANSIRQEFRLCMAQEHLMRESWVEVRMSDFNLWAAGVGATAGRRASLDTRLQALPDELTTLKHLLSSLKKSLADCRRFNGKELDDSKEIVDLIIENLAMLATVIRRTGRRSRFRRADRHFDPQRQLYFRAHLECIILLRPSENGALFRPAVQTDPKDWSKVIPSLAEALSGLTPLQERLVVANLRRRYWFLSAQRHSERLAETRAPKKPESPAADRSRPITNSGEEGSAQVSQRSHGQSPSNPPDFLGDETARHIPSDLSTKASTVESKSPTKTKHREPESAMTRITVILAATEYPSLVKQDVHEMRSTGNYV
ncbi:hypothetical protein GQ53DRAFT_881155 [Thozetella sp. PMI_491]|nr:hypothetical protein GQ53DRAFT_881155 [Thozetella sp. PMI_491]